MRLSELRELVRILTSSYFARANVTFTRQSRVAKPEIPLMSITMGNVKRSRDSVNKVFDDTTVSAYPSKIAITFDLFTHGAPVRDENGNVFAYENTAVDDMLAFADFLGSPYVTDWSGRNDIAIVIDGDVQDMTGVVNDNNYEFRSRMNVMVYFTQHAVGAAGVLSEESLQYPTGEYDSKGNPIYTTKEPEKTVSSTGYNSAEYDRYGGIPGYIPAEILIPQPVVVPKPNTTSTGGGGSEELIEHEIGYFTQAEFKEETGNE